MDSALGAALCLQAGLSVVPQQYSKPALPGQLSVFRSKLWEMHGSTSEKKQPPRNMEGKCPKHHPSVTPTMSLPSDTFRMQTQAVCQQGRALTQLTARRKDERLQRSRNSTWEKRSVPRGRTMLPNTLQVAAQPQREDCGRGLRAETEQLGTRRSPGGASRRGHSRKAAAPVRGSGPAAPRWEPGERRERGKLRGGVPWWGLVSQRNL